MEREGYDINKFLNNEFNSQLYVSLIELFEFLFSENAIKELDSFIEVLAKNFEYVKGNHNRPHEVAEKIEIVRLSLNDRVCLSFYSQLLKLLCNEFNPDLNNCIRLIDL